MHSRSGLKWTHLVFMPSFYGAWTWGTALVLYLLRLLSWDEPTDLVLVILILTEGLFLLSLLCLSPLYKAWLTTWNDRQRREELKFDDSSWRGLLLVLHMIGGVGIALYILDFSVGLGGVGDFFAALVHNSSLVRKQLHFVTSVGTQISYVGWLAITLTLFEVARGNLSGKWLALALVQFVANFVFVNRARPIWIVFTATLMVLRIKTNLNLRVWVSRILPVFLLLLVLFFGIAQWVGKTVEDGQYGTSVLPETVQGLYYYITCGFPYLNQIIENDDEVTYIPARTLYPGFKVLAKVGLAEEPPNPINDFLNVPFSTNVGTFLEPFYRDGGYLYVGLGMVLYSFGLDLLALICLNSCKSLVVFVWANLCYATFISFFACRTNSTPLWFFGLLGIVAYFFQRPFATVKLQEVST